LHKTLREKGSFNEFDFATLQRGQTVVKLLPVQDKSEVAVSGLVSLQVPAEVFLQSFRDSMLRRSNSAILEIGSFGGQPTLDDLKDLTIDTRDIEDLKKCVVGNCLMKLSASMIERIQKEINWETADYRAQATHLLKLMLLDYVRDYLARGDVALIEYNDKAKAVRLAAEQSALKSSSIYITDGPANSLQYPKGFSQPNLVAIENAIVWSKVKFGLKPVITFNHITIYRNEKKTAPQILIVSKQIYANHYFDSSLALTAFISIPGANSASYLLYENRSRADGLGGPFSKIKRGIVEEKAVAGLEAILAQSKVNLNARSSSRFESAPPNANEGKRNWTRWTSGAIYLFFWMFLITAFAAFFVLGNYDWKGVSKGAHN